MVAVHRFDLAAFGPEPFAPSVAVVGDVPFDPRSFAALADFRVHRVADAAALEQLTAETTVDAVVAGSSGGLAELTSRLRARLIVIAPELPEPLVEAVGRGADARWAPDAAALVDELLRLRAARRADATRHRLDDVRVHFAASVPAARLRDLSNDGIAFEVAGVDVERLLPGSVLDDIRLRRHGRDCSSAPMRAIVRHIEPLADRGHYLVGCAWKPRSSAPPSTPVRNRALCAALVKAGLATGVVIADVDDDARDGGGEVQLVGGRVDAARGTLTAICEAPLAEHDLVRGRFELAGFLYRFTTVVLNAQPLVLKLPTVLDETQQRASARHRLGSEEPLSATLRSPLVDGAAVKPLIDLSANGFSFAVDSAHDLYPIGLSLEVTLRLPGGPITCAGEVRTIVREASGLRCGVELVDGDASSRLRLANFVMRLRCPGVDDGGGIGCDELFGFMRETGFLTPAKEEALRPVAPEVRDAFQVLYAAPSRIFKAVVAREEGAVAGHVSGVRAYRQTWVAQHLTTRPAVHVGHLLNLGAAEYFCQTPDFEFFKIYFHADNKWPARVFGGFARTLRDLQLSDLRLYRHLAVQTDAPLPSAPDGIDVLEASPDDLEAVERYFVERERGLLLRSDDLTRQTLQLSTLNKEFGALGLYRRRRVLLAMRRNVVLGFALAELSSPGLNLSEALSAFQIFVTEQGQSDGDGVRRALVGGVIPIYRHAGRPIARGLIAADEIAAWQRIGVPVSDEVSMCWTYHRTLCARFCNHVERLFEAVERRARRTQRAA